MSYAAEDQTRRRRDFYWRRIDDTVIELIASAQTDLLDDTARLRVTTSLPDVECLWTADSNASTGAFVARLTPTHSYVEMVYPGDALPSVIVRRGNQLDLETTLFPESLEKGVIRRGRLRAAIVPCLDDLHIASQLYDEFIRSAIPLTT